MIDKIFKACHIPFLCNTFTNDGYIDRFVSKCKEGCCDSKNIEYITSRILSWNTLKMLSVPDESYINSNFWNGFCE
jgi:hypothetical protein